MPNYEAILASVEEKGFGPVPQEPRGSVIRSLADIPDLMTLNVSPATPIVDGLLYSGSMTLWAGADGSAKTFLLQSMALAVGAGARFLDRQCRQAEVLYLDYENPGYAVKDRIELLTGFPNAPQPLTRVRFWGTWLEHQPPQIGSDLLLQICRESKPLLIVDPLRYAHDGEENDSGEMMMVMRHLRSYASAGATVLVIHHVAKTEGSTYRGSTALRGAFDVSYLQEQNDETGLLKLQCVKNRFGDKPVVYIRPDFDNGTFDVTDSPAWTKNKGDLDKICQIIAAQPGISQKQVADKAGIKRTRAIELLREHNGRLWETKGGTRGSILYYPLVPNSPEQVGTAGTCQVTVTCSPVPSLVEGTGGTVSQQTKKTCSESAMKCQKYTVCPSCHKWSVSHYSDGTKSCDFGCPEVGQ